MSSKKIRELFRFNKTQGDIGIEIEMEGQGLAISTSSWAEHLDGSLRGNSIEYVLAAPCKRDEVSKKLQELEDGWKRYGSLLEPSNRCGVHVHLNCQEKTVEEVATLLGIYYCFEDLLLKYCGEDRDGNFFCLGARHAEVQLTELYHMMCNGTFTPAQMDQHYRYAALNITSLAKFGSLEFRPLKTTKSMAPVMDWVNIILCLNDKSLSYKNVREVVESCSAAGAHKFLCDTFGRYAEQLMCKKYDKLIMDGVRRVQEFAYAPQVMKNKKDKAKYDLLGFDAGEAVVGHIHFQPFDGHWLRAGEEVAPQAAGQGVPIPPMPKPPISDVDAEDLAALRARVKIAKDAWIAAGRYDAPARFADEYNRTYRVWNNRKNLLRVNYELTLEQRSEP